MRKPKKPSIQNELYSIRDSIKTINWEVDSITQAAKCARAISKSHAAHLDTLIANVELGAENSIKNTMNQNLLRIDVDDNTLSLQTLRHHLIGTNVLLLILAIALAVVASGCAGAPLPKPTTVSECEAITMRVARCFNDIPELKYAMSETKGRCDYAFHHPTAEVSQSHIDEMRFWGAASCEEISDYIMMSCEGPKEACDARRKYLFREGVE